MIFYPDIITLPEKHPGLKVQVDVWESASGGKNLYMDLEFHLDDEMRKACKWISTRFKTDDNIDKSFRTITVASFLMITPDANYDNAILVNLKKSDDDDKTENTKKSKSDANKMLKEMGVEDYDRISTRKSSNSSTILNRNDDDVEKLKKQILKK